MQLVGRRQRGRPGRPAPSLPRSTADGRVQSTRSNGVGRTRRGGEQRGCRVRASDSSAGVGVARHARSAGGTRFPSRRAAPSSRTDRRSLPAAIRPEAPAASATRAIAPTLPGSCTSTATMRSGRGVCGGTRPREIVMRPGGDRDDAARRRHRAHRLHAPAPAPAPRVRPCRRDSWPASAPARRPPPAPSPKTPRSRSRSAPPALPRRDAAHRAACAPRPRRCSARAGGLSATRGFLREEMVSGSIIVGAKAHECQGASWVRAPAAVHALQHLQHPAPCTCTRRTGAPVAPGTVLDFPLP